MRVKLCGVLKRTYLQNVKIKKHQNFLIFWAINNTSFDIPNILDKEITIVQPMKDLMMKRISSKRFTEILNLTVDLLKLLLILILK